MRRKFLSARIRKVSPRSSGKGVGDWLGCPQRGWGFSDVEMRLTSSGSIPGRSPRELVKWKNAWVMGNEVSQTVLNTLNPRLR
jgi:hypothetical protein